MRELPVIEPGWNVLDDNLLACSRSHLEKVFAMLRSEKASGHRIQFTGGLEAARLTSWHIGQFAVLKPKQLFFAYDTPDDLGPLQQAGRLMMEAGWTKRGKQLRAYVLVGFPKDTFEGAERRLHQTIEAGFIPMAMLYRDPKTSRVDQEWREFQRLWARPALHARQVKPRRRVRFDNR